MALDSLGAPYLLILLGLTIRERAARRARSAEIS